METKELKKLIEKYLTPINSIIFFLGLAILVVLGVLGIQRFTKKTPTSITENQIMIRKGEKVVIVDQSGLVEYRTPDGVFYETWDSIRISDFFDYMRTKAREYLANPPPASGKDGYYVTLYIDGEEVTIFIEEGDEVLDEIYEEFDQGSEGDLGDYFDDFFDDGDGGGEDGQGEDDGDGGGEDSLTPTPTPIYVGGYEEDDYELGLYDCTLFEAQVTGRTVISNTLCIIEDLINR